MNRGTARYPLLEIDLDKLKANLAALIERCQSLSVEVTGVVKGFSALPEAAGVYTECGVRSLASSRLSQLRALRGAGVACERVLIRIPMLSELPEVAEVADMSLQSELETLRALNAVCAKRGTRHRVILMADLGDLREGFWSREELVDAALEVEYKLDHLELAGVGTNLGCYGSVAATPEKQRHYLDIVYNKSVVLEKLVRNMSDFSEYELGRMQYHFEYVDMTPFLQDLAEEYQYDVQQSGMTFQAALPKGSYTVTADRGKLKRVLDNLVSNAVKYGKPGGEIHFSAEEYEGGLVLQVTDNGKGISPQALHHVFDSFFRADAARTSSVPGSGLGLAICRSIVDSHHGKIWLTSEEGEGTRAFVYLPLQKEEGMA